MRIFKLSVMQGVFDESLEETVLNTEISFEEMEYRPWNSEETVL